MLARTLMLRELGSGAQPNAIRGATAMEQFTRSGQRGSR
jgi:hypothetical protein